MSRIGSFLIQAALCAALVVVIGWPALATVVESARASARSSEALPGTGMSMDPAGSAAIMRESGMLPRPLRLARETLLLVVGAEAIALPAGIVAALLLFRTDILGRRAMLAVIALAAFVPLPLHATAWLGAFGNAGRLQALGMQPILVGRFGAAVVHALAALPWVILIVGVGLCSVEPELEESALLDYGPLSVILRVTLRRAIVIIAAAALATAVLTAGDMTVTDLLQIRTYAEEAYLQYSLGRGPGEAAAVALPPLFVLGTLIVLVGWALSRRDPARIASSFANARIWQLGAWRTPGSVLMLALLGNLAALPLYSLIWRAGRVGGRATLGRPPTWSLAGLAGTLRAAADEIWEPLLASLAWTAVAATLTAALACALAWASRRSIVWRCVAFATLARLLAAPGPIAGMALVLAYRSVPAIYDSPAMVIMAETMRSLPYAILLIWPLFRAFPQEYLDAAALDGYGAWGKLIRVVLPMSVRPLAATWAVAFAIGLGELPATNLATPPGTPPMSVVIWSLLHTGVESHLSGVALIMLTVVAAAGLVAALAVWSLRTTARAFERN